MRAGKLRDYVHLQSETLVADGGGGNAKGWVTYASVWGDLQAEQGSEDVQGASLRGKVAHRLLIYYRGDITAAHRVLHNDGRVFNIRAVLPEQARGELVLRLEQGVAT